MASKKAADKSAVRRATPGGTTTPPTSSTPPTPAPTLHVEPAPVRVRAGRVALRALVPSAFNPEGERDPFLHAYKARWLSRLNFKSDASIQSLLALSFMLLARERPKEAEQVTDQLIKHMDPRQLSSAGAFTLVSALYLSAWLKEKRGLDTSPLLARARVVEKRLVHKDRAWLSHDALPDIEAALARGKLDYLIDPFSGILRFLNDSGARPKAESVLAVALDATRSLMR